MKPKHVEKFRRISSKRWYLRMRIWKCRILEQHFRDIIHHGARDHQLEHFTDAMARAYAKRRWYERRAK